MDSAAAVLLLDLVDALSRAHNETTCIQTACDLLAERLSVVFVSVVFEGVDNAVTRTIDAHPHVPPLGRRKAAVKVKVTRRSTSIDEVGAERGHMLFDFAATVPRANLVVAIGRVVAAALRHVRTIARVAEVSRLAYARSRELDDRLRELVPSSIVAVSPATRRIFMEIVPSVARTNTCVLIQGETGTGKELVARRIHELSPRARRAFIRVNCGAIPAGLVESTLFGHERGAFTGAVRRQTGVFERAHEGTLFLDEIGELSLAAQVKLLRVLEAGEIERVGGDRTFSVDVRIVAATHRDLTAMVRGGTFRSDLFYRLDIVSIRVPPLRERPDEIEVLARQLLRDLARRFGHPPPTLSRQVLRRLRAHAWRGNVRELQNVLERSLLFSREGSFDLDLPPNEDTRGTVLSFDAAARHSIEDALAASNGRIYGRNGAAAILRLKPTTLASKMKKLGVVAKAIRAR